MNCIKCDRPKEPTRTKSRLCRACDGAAQAKREGGQVTAQRRLTLNLPVDVWDRLDAEAQEHGQRAAGFLRNRVITRDKNRQKKEDI